MATETRELVMSSQATASYIWISATKVRQAADLIKGQPVDEARRILAFTPTAAARFLSKVLESAIANAEHNHQIPQDELAVQSAWADEGPTFKRWQPRARRAAYPIRKRTSHITVIVERAQREVGRVPDARTRRARPAEPEAPAEAEQDAGTRKAPSRSGGSGRSRKSKTSPKTKGGAKEQGEKGPAASSGKGRAREQGASRAKSSAKSQKTTVRKGQSPSTGSAGKKGK